MKMMVNKMHLEEIKLSRDLMNAIEDSLHWGKVVPEPVYNAYLKLKEHYNKEIEEGVM